MDLNVRSPAALPAASSLVEPVSEERALTAFRRARMAVGTRLNGALGRRGRPRRRLFSLGRRGLFYLMVVLPTFATAIYLFFIASDQYVSEAQFVVRSAQRQAASGLGALLQGSGLSGVRDDSYSVIEFIKSRDALNEVDAKAGFRSMMSRPGADFIARFPQFWSRDTFEEMYEHYQSVVSVTHDTTTGVASLKVRTFVPADSKKLAEALLDAGERLVNRMNERSLGDAVALAEREVKKSEERLALAQSALTAQRVSAGLVDVSSTTKSFVELLGGLEKELAASRAQLTQTRAASPNSPGIQPLRDRVSALEQQIASERGKLVGADGALVGTFAEFERLTLESDFAAKSLVVANGMLEAARMEALRKQLYLERVVEPNAADLSRYPRRFITVISVFGVTFMAYAVLWLLVVNAREHVS